jgi:CDP-glycerol glycerophosphotransferase (TagB/SpsB family)
LHDSFRFDKEYRGFLGSLANRYDNVLIKYKNHHPDNLLDLQISDCLITNFSSIANLFYATGRPTIHIYPVKHADEEFLWRNKTFAGVYKKRVNSARYIWKLDPEENGGLLANDFEELQEQVEYSIEHPDCCRGATEEFLDKYMLGADGGNCERIWETLQKLVNEGNVSPRNQLNYAEVNG